MKKMSGIDLAIEITRRCNMECDHCLRGWSEDMDINMQDVADVLDQIDRVNHLTFTGGEPSLRPHVIEEILGMCKERRVEVGSFYIATNGLKITESFVVACLRWYAYCDDNECTHVHVSNDGFHTEQGDYDVNLLKGLSFFSFKEQQDGEYSDKGLVAQGHRDGHFEAREITPDDFEIEKISHNNYNVYDGTLYLNCEGKLIAGCNWSYESQREREDIVICRAQESIVDALLERMVTNGVD